MRYSIPFAIIACALLVIAVTPTANATPTTTSKRACVPDRIVAVSCATGTVTTTDKLCAWEWNEKIPDWEWVCYVIWKQELLIETQATCAEVFTQATEPLSDCNILGPPVYRTNSKETRHVWKCCYDAWQAYSQGGVCVYADTLVTCKPLEHAHPLPNPPADKPCTIPTSGGAARASATVEASANCGDSQSTAAATWATNGAPAYAAQVAATPPDVDVS